MQFQMTISERDFLNGYRLKTRSVFRRLASISVIALVVILWGFVITGYAIRALATAPGNLESELIFFGKVFLAPAIYFALVLALFKVIAPWNISRAYRKNKNIQREFSTEVIDEGIRQTSSNGSSGFSVWDSFSFWRESTELFIVVAPSKIFFILPKSSLASGQVDELRSYLAKYLPRK